MGKDYKEGTRIYKEEISLTSVRMQVTVIPPPENILSFLFPLELQENLCILKRHRGHWEAGLRQSLLGVVPQYGGLA